MNNWILILAAMILMIVAPDIRAHNLVSATGHTKDHQHVYRRQEYGKPLQQGHLSQSSGGGGTILWGSPARSDYGKSTVRRSGPIIGDRRFRPHATPGAKSKYGSAVNGYGKAVSGYGKTVNGYGKALKTK